MPFFVRQKVQISSKILPQMPNFGNFVKFRQKSIFLSRQPVLVMSSIFHQKSYSLEPIYHIRSSDRCLWTCRFSLWVWSVYRYLAITRICLFTSSVELKSVYAHRPELTV